MGLLKVSYMYKIYLSPLFFPASLPAEDVLPLTEENEIMTLHFLYCHRMSCKNFSQVYDMN